MHGVTVQSISCASLFLIEDVGVDSTFFETCVFVIFTVPVT